MAILFAASELEAFKITSTTDITGVTTAAELDGAVARAAMRIQQAAVAHIDFTGQSAGWAHWKMHCDDPDGLNSNLVRLIDTATGDEGVFRLRTGTASSTSQMLTASPGTWQVQPSAARTGHFDHQGGNGDERQPPSALGILPANETITFDFNWDMQTVGFFEWFINGVSAARFDGDTAVASNTQVDRIEFSNGTADNDGITYSEIIVADEDTRGMRVVTIDPTGNGGTNTAWTGDVTDIDETALSDVDLISSNTTGQIEQFTGGNLPTDGWDILAFVVGFRGKDDASGVQQVRASLRSGTTDYNGATQAMPAAFEGFYEIWELDPDTAAAWTAAGIDAVEYGVESIT